MRSLVIASLTSLCLALPAAASAQQPTPTPSTQRIGLPIVPGTRVRVSASTLVAPLIANFFEMRGDTAVFIENSSGRGIWTFTLDQITKLERSAGEQRMNTDYMVKGGVAGFGVGALGGLVVASAFDPSDKTRRYSRIGSAAIGGVIGAGIGVLVGSRFTREGWTPLPLVSRMSFVPGRRGGVDVGMRLSF